jgi:hypothetical protein
MRGDPGTVAELKRRLDALTGRAKIADRNCCRTTTNEDREL